MSTEGTGADGPGAPLTRAQLRAQREAAQAAAGAAAAPAEAPVPAPTPPNPDAASPTPGPVPPTPDAAPPAPAVSTPVGPAIPAPTTPIIVGAAPTASATAHSPARGTEPGGATPERAPEYAPGQTPGRTTEHTPRRTSTDDRRFTVTLLSVLGVLALVVGALGAVSLTQGPRISDVHVDAAQAIATSGSRLILTANQRLDTVDPGQITVEPAVPFTVDAAGRSIGIRFTVPLDDSTTYTVAVAGVTGAGGGPQTDFTTTFTTPASQILLLQRAPEDEPDKIFSTDLRGERARPVFEHPRIADYRATPGLIVVAVEEESGSRLLVMNRDGSDQRELTLPGDGYVSSVQVSDRGGFVGYSYSDRELTETTGRASVLVTQPLNGTGEPRIVQVDGADASMAEWQFVPDSSSLLFIDFDGALGVEDAAADAGVQSMGVAASILGISRGTYTAIIERTDGGIRQVDLTSGEESPLPASEPDYGDADAIVPFPGGTLRHVVQRDESGMPTGQAVVRVLEDGSADVITEVSGTDAILQTCVSPSGQYAAVVIAPDLPENPYDTLLLPLPGTLHTHLIDLDGDRKLPTLSGFDISWCAQAPRP